MMPRNAQPQNRGLRKAERKSVRLEASIRGQGIVRFDVNVRDISSTGFRFETSFNLHPGTRVWLMVAGFNGFEAIIAWRDARIYGCSFVAPLHQAVCDHLARLYPAADSK